MVTVLCLFTCVLAPAQPPGDSTTLTVPRLVRGQELVYSGSYREEAVGKGVQFARSYRLETRTFVLDDSAHTNNIAILTTLKLRPTRSQAGSAPEPTSVRLDLARMTQEGKVVLQSGVSPALPLDGPPTIECGNFLQLPHGRAGRGKTWEVAGDDGPPRNWQVAGMEMVNGVRCFKVLGVQQSDDWERPRADRTAWLRRDTLWVVPGLGITNRVERIIECREPARRDITQRSMTSYNLESQVVYPALLFEDRRREILQYCALAEAALPILREPEKSGPRSAESLQTKITQLIETSPATPYRGALLQLKRRVEAVSRGDTVPFDPSEEASPVAPLAALGQPAPDFLVSDMATRESLRLRRLLGRPIVLVFYAPSSKTCNDVLRFAQSLNDANPREIHVLGLVVSDDPDPVAKQRQELKLTIPILAGQGLRLTYGVDATPKIVLLDAAGVVRGNYVGWGPETPRIVTEELQRCRQGGLLNEREGGKPTQHPSTQGKIGN
jgi:peroxiredoxin